MPARTRPRPSRGRSDGRRVRAGNGCGGGYFPPRAVDEITAVDGSNARFASRSKIAATSAILRWRFGPPLSLRVLARPAHRLK
jgi:hypothetical protein